MKLFDLHEDKTISSDEVAYPLKISVQYIGDRKFSKDVIEIANTVTRIDGKGSGKDDTYGESFEYKLSKKTDYEEAIELAKKIFGRFKTFNDQDGIDSSKRIKTKEYLVTVLDTKGNMFYTSVANTASGVLVKVK